MFNFFKDNSIISKWQSGFMPQCSTVCQLVELYHNFCRHVEDGKEVRVVFLDISRAFDRVWHAGLLHKLRRCGIGGPLLNWLSNYLNDRKQRVCLNGKFSDWAAVLAGVPQGSILGPLLFLIFINDLTEVLRFSQIRLFADDTCVYISIDNRERARELINLDLQAIHNWSKRWLVNFSVPKTKALIVSNKLDRHNNPSVEMNNTHIDEVQSHKHLGVIIHQSLTWSSHIDEIYIKAMRRLDVIQRMKFKLPRQCLQRYYFSFVLPILEYADILWNGANDQDLSKLDRVHLRAMRIVTGATQRCNTQALYDDVCWSTLSHRRLIHRLRLFYKIRNNISPNYLMQLMPQTVYERNPYALRNREDLTPFRTRRQLFYKSFFPQTTRDWNDLPIEIRCAPTIYSFNQLLNLRFPTLKSKLWYGQGDRGLDIIHTRIRMGCSSLKHHLHYNLHVEANPYCTCGRVIETPAHYFLSCNRFANSRLNLLNEISEYTTPTIEVILFGDPNLTVNDNILIVLAVQNYIKLSKRFK